jgi:DNA-damage-inducible protein D
MSDSMPAIPQSMSESPFEQIKQTDADGNEFWSARDLMQIIEYANYHKFKSVLLKAQIACENSGYNPDDHFYSAVKMVTLGSDAKREVEDMHLSRYACYLVVQNADPSKEVVATGQTYFAIQTRRAELADEKAAEGLTEAQRRLLLRERVKRQNAELASTARNAGVLTGQDFAVFQNHGYRGLYNGLTAEDIHRRKKLKKSQHILDHMGTTELAANMFRSTQAEEKLRRDNIEGQDNANRVHYEAGVIVRRAIEEMGGTMPENLPTAESIKTLERDEKKRLAASKKDKAE